MSVESIFDREEFKPLRSRWNSRLKELARRASYYDGSVYKHIPELLGWFGPRFYQKIRPLYLPLARAVDVDAGIIPAGWTFSDDAPEVWAPARKAVFDWSSWKTDGVLLVHYGAQYGVVGLKVADVRLEKRIVISALDPQTFMLVGAGETPDMALVIEKRTDAAGNPFQYAEVVTPDLIRTFKNGVPMGFDGREAEYQNDLGFVPFVETVHIENGKPLGECTFQKAIPLLDEVNGLASRLADIVNRHAEPQWAVFGSESSDLVKSGDNVWFFPGEGSDARPLVADIDVPGVLEFVREIRDQVHGALPELSFDELRKKDQIATATLELQLMELVLKVHRTRPNYDEALAQALRLAGRAARSMGIPEVAVLDDPALAFDEQRPVIPLDPETRMRLELMELELQMQRAMVEGS
jgi:hypothetical protein